jgi:telomere length regulation protein
MLAAEIIADRVGKKLSFGDWNGDDMGKPWARKLRLLIAARDVDVDTVIEDDTDEMCAPLASQTEGTEILKEGARQAYKEQQDSLVGCERRV